MHRYHPQRYRKDSLVPLSVATAVGILGIVLILFSVFTIVATAVAAAYIEFEFDRTSRAIGLAVVGGLVVFGLPLYNLVIGLF